jgi:integrase
MKNVQRSGKTLRAKVHVGPFQVTKRFKAGTSPTTIKNWIEDTRTALRKKVRNRRGSTGSLAADFDRYLKQVAAMPTFAERERHLTLWLDALGRDKHRDDVTPDDIRAVLQAWRQTLDADTCNKRRTALMHVWSVLDGKGARNPVRDTPKFTPPQALPRGRDPFVIDAVLKVRQPSRLKACSRVLLWTGMRPIELARAKPDDVNLELRTAIIRTAKRGKVRVIPLTDQGIDAWKEFDAEDCWGNLPQAAPWNRWLKHVTGIDDLRVYDLRHSYGTALARLETRLDVIGSMMGHSTLELTKRYTLAAISPAALAAVVKLGTETVPDSQGEGRNQAESEGISGAKG